jgi:L-ascorbate metabolism protein UlaG (beta-lactamase superfamily)
MLLRIAILAILVSASAQRPALEARFIGNMAFAITDGAVTLMSDFPYQSGYSRYMTYQPAEIRSTTPSTLSLVTHRHGDHWEPALFNGTNWQVAGPADVTAPVPADRVIRLAAHTAFGPIAIERIETPHAGIGHHSYIVTWHGRRLYFSGDTESSDSLAAARNLDVAFVSPWLFRSMVKRGIRIDAKRVVIYHHTSGERVAECSAGCVLPRQGDTIQIP